MYLKNTSKGYIPTGKGERVFTHDGYGFRIPPGVSAIWDPAGKALLNNYKVDSKGGKDKYGFDNGHGLPALFEITKEEWIKQGKKLVEVTRFKINSKLIPRVSLIKLALQRGVSANRCTEYQLDSLIDSETIVDEINALPVPDEIKYPVNIEDDSNDDSET